MTSPLSHPLRRPILPTANDPRTEEEMMLKGELYYGFEKELTLKRDRARALCAKLNRIDDVPADHDDRKAVLKQLIGGYDDTCYIESPFRCDYGSNIYLGKRVYMNSYALILDCNKVTIGDDVLIGPNVQIYTAYHPLEPELRTLGGPELAKEIKIGNDVWIGGSAVILPGVTIGDGSVIGGGSVVTKDVEPRVVVAGNPARVIRRIQ
ncbi:hypothetical protein HDU97_001172 [Phlyctochytrium planicorne]|nr:hypothetical protein HDU97_001172 [Phlyctochytrium planicorne]